MFDEFFARLRIAEADLVEAAHALPDSPLPWGALLTTARGLQIPRAEAEERYVRHVERGATLAGHMSFQQFVCDKWFGSHNDMWEQAHFVCDNAPDGSPLLAIAPMAFLEHWISDHGFEEPYELLEASGQEEFIKRSMVRSHTHPAFPVAQPHAAKALGIFITMYSLVGDNKDSAELIPMIGDRMPEFPICYLSQADWSTLRSEILRRAAR